MNDERYQIPKLSPEDQAIIDAYNEQIAVADQYRLDYITDLGDTTLEKIKKEIAEEIFSGLMYQMVKKLDDKVTETLNRNPEEKPELPPLETDLMIDGYVVEKADSAGSAERVKAFFEALNKNQ